MPRFQQPQVDKCKACTKTVYPMEQLSIENGHYHKACFRCHQCNRTLSVGTYASLDGVIFCKPHFLQLFKSNGNYEEGFGKDRHKNKWSSSGVHVEKTPSGQSVVVNGAAPSTQTSKSTSEEKEIVKVDRDDIDKVATNGHRMPSVSREATPDEGSENGVIEESSLSLKDKKSQLYGSSHRDERKEGGKPAPGKLAKWQPQRTISQDADSRPKPAPKKLNINWSAQASVKRDETKSDDGQPEWVRKAKERNLKFEGLGSVKSRFEKGEVGKKIFRSESKDEERPKKPLLKPVPAPKKLKVDAVKATVGRALETISRFETRKEKQYDGTKRRELEELEAARLEKQEEIVEDEDDRRQDEESRKRPAKPALPPRKYKELEGFRKAAAAKEKKNKFESGPFSNREEVEFEARREVQSFMGKGTAKGTKELYEKGEYEKVSYVSPVKQEITTIKADTHGKKEIYEAGGKSDRSYESSARKELESLQTEASSTKSRFEAGEFTKEFKSNNPDDLEEVKVNAAAAESKSKFESGELIRRDFESDTKKELETLKTDAGSTKNKYESGELVRTEFDSEAKQELGTIKSGAREKLNKYETGDLEHAEYQSEVKKEVESMRGQVAAATILDKYQHEVEEGNKVVTSKPVTIEKSKPEDYGLTRDEDEYLKVQNGSGDPSGYQGHLDTNEAESSYDEPEASFNEPETSFEDQPLSPSDCPYDQANNVHYELSSSEDAGEDDSGPDDLNDYEYVSMPEPKKLTNIEERFKKPEVEKEAPQVNKIQIPTFEKRASSDEEDELNNSSPTEEEAAALKEQLWSIKTSDIKSRFESTNDTEELKSTPKQIDLQAEVNDEDYI